MSKRMKPARIRIDAGGGVPLDVELSEMEVLGAGPAIGLNIKAGKGSMTLVLSPVGDAVRGVVAWLDEYAARHALPAPPAAPPPAVPKRPAPSRRPATPKSKAKK